MAFPSDPGPQRQPFFNVPPVILILAGIMVAIEILTQFLLGDLQVLWVTANFAFIPDREVLSGVPVDILPGSGVWSYLTYAFLHADLIHLGVNMVAMLAFGSPLAWRFGWRRFLLFSAVGAIAGALAHDLLHPNGYVPLVGASAAISAHMAGAARFLFIGQGWGVRNYYAPAAPLGVVFTDRRTLSFLLAWFAINLVVGVIGFGTSEGTTIAWEAHLGGFLAGLFLFAMFDPPVWPTQAAGDERFP